MFYFGIVMICFWRLWTSTYYCQHFSEDSNIIVYFLKFSKCILSSLEFPEVLRMFKKITDALELSRLLTTSVESSGIFRMGETMRTKCRHLKVSKWFDFHETQFRSNMCFCYLSRCSWNCNSYRFGGFQNLHFLV